MCTSDHSSRIVNQTAVITERIIRLHMYILSHLPPGNTMCCWLGEICVSALEALNSPVNQIILGRGLEK
jgi:hypothetical protein